MQMEGLGSFLQAHRGRHTLTILSSVCVKPRAVLKRRAPETNWTTRDLGVLRSPFIREHLFADQTSLYSSFEREE
jgi:hypothetical protein